MDAFSIRTEIIMSVFNYELNYIIGEFYNDKANNYGIYSHFSGANYEGLWLEDSQHGIGIEIWKDYSFYSGEYVNGKKQGLGNIDCWLLYFLYIFLKVALNNIYII